LDTVKCEHQLAWLAIMTLAALHDEDGDVLLWMCEEKGPPFVTQNLPDAILKLMSRASGNMPESFLHIHLVHTPHYPMNLALFKGFCATW